MRLSLRAPTPVVLDRLLSEQADQDLTYPDVGATAEVMPSGYRIVRESIELGDDPSIVERLGELLCTWEVHRTAGLEVHAGGRADTLGTDAVLAARLLGPRVLLACRVVRVVEEPGRIGFAYGTLPMHPESGEESFIVERDAGRVRFSVTAFSRPASRIRRLPAPLHDRVQDRFTTRYLQAARTLAMR